MIDEDVELLREHAVEITPGKWSFGFTQNSAELALDFIKTCLALDIPVSETLTMKAWCRVVNKILELEKQVEQLRNSGK